MFDTAKRENFYKKLSEVNFGDIKAVSMDAFKYITCNELDKFISLCRETLKNRKGKETIECLKSMAKSAEELKKEVSGIKASGELDIAKKMSNKIDNLRQTLVATSEKRFPHKLRRSTLDYEPTRKKLKELSKEELLSLLGTFLVMIFDRNVSILIEKIDKVLKKNSFEKKDNFKSLLFMFYKAGRSYMVKKYTLVTHFERDDGIQALILNLEELLDRDNDIVDITPYRKQIENLIERLEEKLPPNQETMCPICYEEYDNDEHKRAVLPCRGQHIICKACLLQLDLLPDEETAACPFCKDRIYYYDTIYHNNYRCYKCGTKITLSKGSEIIAFPDNIYHIYCKDCYAKTFNP